MHTEGAMGFALARHGVDQAIEIFMPIAGGARALMHEIDVHRDPWDVADVQGHSLLLFAVGSLSACSPGGWCPLCMARFRWARRAADRLASGRRPGRWDVVQQCGWPLVQRISAVVQPVVASSEIVCSSCAIAPLVHVAL